jgi:ADP-dependent NAD(P)H-hydrate dehydratase / NAD(P)H-hydrate epimerase
MNLNQIKKLMEKKKTSHKGENGYVLIVGGSEDYTTAPALAGLSALRAGCDSVTIAAPEKVAWVMNQISLDLISHKVKGTNLNIKNAKELAKFADRFDAILLGNGLTRASDKFCQTFIKKFQGLKVIDADALKSASFKDFHNSILTPHEKELEIMLTNSGKEFLLPKIRQSNAKEKADILQGNLRYFLQNNNVLLLKGATDIIISRNKIAFNRTGNPGMTKAGTGDVLAGLVLGFLGKTKDMFKSAVAGSYINGMVGDQLLKKKKGYAFIASDIVEDLEKLEKKLSSMKQSKRKVKKIVKKKPAKKVLKKKKVSKKKKVEKKKVIKKKQVKKKVTRKKKK